MAQQKSDVQFTSKVEVIENERVVSLYMMTTQGVELFIDMCHCNCGDDCTCVEAMVTRFVKKQFVVTPLNNANIRMSPHSIVKNIKITSRASEQVGSAN